MDLEQKYKEETGFDVGKIHTTGVTYYSDDYVEWLEKKINYTRCCEELICDHCENIASVVECRCDKCELNIHG